MEDVLKQIPYYLRDGRDLAELLSGEVTRMSEDEGARGRDLAELLPRAWASRNQL